jgi:enterochelin esterase-like enzyme
LPDWPLIDGWVPVALTVVGVLGLVWLLWGSGRRWWTVQVPTALGAGALAAVLTKIVDGIWRPSEDPLSWVAASAVGVTVTAVVLAVLGPRRRPVGIVSVVAACCVAVSSAAAVNQQDGRYPTIGALLRTDDPDNRIDFLPASVAADQLVASPPGIALSEVWMPPPGMPARGAVASAPVPGTRSGFRARDAWIYLPPAYLSTPRAELPAIILMSGQPGDPRDWFEDGRLAGVLDAFARRHQGLAPVVVAVDHLGDPLANPGCVDSTLGNVYTYLTVDVPMWIGQSLQVAPDTLDWAVGGLSSGGTCALTLALTAPATYRTFLDISGEDAVNPIPPPDADDLVPEIPGDRAPPGIPGEPSPGDIPDLIGLLRTEQFPGTAGYFVAGADDTFYLPQQQRVVDAAAGSGMTIDYVELPGEHEWIVWGVAFELDLPKLAARLGLIR